MKNRVFPKCLYVVVPYRYFGVREPLSMEKYPHWLSQPYLCDFVFSNHSFHLEFQVILCEIPSEIISADTVAPTSQSTWTFPETIKIQNNYHENTFLPQTTKICSLGISHGITWNSKWNEMMSGGRVVHTVLPHITEHLHLPGEHKNSK